MRLLEPLENSRTQTVNSLALTSSTQTAAPFRGSASSRYGQLRWTPLLAVRRKMVFGSKSSYNRTALVSLLLRFLFRPWVRVLQKNKENFFRQNDRTYKLLTECTADFLGMGMLVAYGRDSILNFLDLRAPPPSFSSLFLYWISKR